MFLCLLACLRRVAGDSDLVSHCDPCLALFTLLTQTLFLYTPLASLSRVLFLVMLVHLVYTMLTCLCTNDYLKSGTDSAIVHLPLPCFTTLCLLIQVCLFAGVRLVCFSHSDIPHIHPCQRHSSREQLALFCTLFTTTLRSFCALLHVNWAIGARLVLDCS
jgi:hypothetical protein